MLKTFEVRQEENRHRLSDGAAITRRRPLLGARLVVVVGFRSVSFRIYDPFLKKPFSFVCSSSLCVFLLVIVLLRTHGSYIIVGSCPFSSRVRKLRAVAFPFLSRSRSHRFLPAHTHSRILYVSNFLLFIIDVFVSFCI